MWKDITEAGSTGKRGAARGAALTKSREGLGYHVKQTAGPGNTAIRDLLDERFTETLLKFLRAARVGGVKAGVLDRGWYVFRVLPFRSFRRFSSFLTFFAFCMGCARTPCGRSTGVRIPSSFLLLSCCHKSQIGSSTLDITGYKPSGVGGIGCCGKQQSYAETCLYHLSKFALFGKPVMSCLVLISCIYSAAPRPVASDNIEGEVCTKMSCCRQVRDPPYGNPLPPRKAREVKDKGE